MKKNAVIAVIMLMALAIVFLVWKAYFAAPAVVVPGTDAPTKLPVRSGPEAAPFDPQGNYLDSFETLLRDSQ